MDNHMDHIHRRTLEQDSYTTDSWMDSRNDEYYTLDPVTGVHNSVFHSPVPLPEQNIRLAPPAVDMNRGNAGVQYKIYNFNGNPLQTKSDRKRKQSSIVKAKSRRYCDDMLTNNGNISSETEALYQIRYQNNYSSQRSKCSNVKRHVPMPKPLDNAYLFAANNASGNNVLNQLNIRQSFGPVPVASRPQSPGSLISHGAVDGCGGHCTTFQNFCYYFMQVIFVIIILVGVAFCIAGSVLRSNKVHDLSVLVYIGCLISVVAAFLLYIQYCVRRNVKRRQKALRLALNHVQMGDISPKIVPPVPSKHSYVNVAQNSCAADNIIDRMVENSSPPACMHPHTQDHDEDGIPWWRREPYAE